MEEYKLKFSPYCDDALEICQSAYTLKLSKYKTKYGQTFKSYADEYFLHQNGDSTMVDDYDKKSKIDKHLAACIIANFLLVCGEEFHDSKGNDLSLDMSFILEDLARLDPDD